MTPAPTSTRTIEHTRTVAACKQCGRETAGTTTVERRPWAKASAHTYHFCDDCLDAVELRPLDAVLADHVAALVPLST